MSRIQWPALAGTERRVEPGHSLLHLDPELGQLLDDERYGQARAQVRVRVHRRSRGPWRIHAPASEATDHHLGLLLVDGVVASDTVLDDLVSTELLGAGDILRPWALDPSQRLLSENVVLTVLADCRVAVLDQRLATALVAYPEIYTALMRRVDQRARRLATTQAIAELNRVERRVLTMLWHLAERWGRVTADGILIPLDLSHRLLSQLVGARRPTVSTALGELVREGTVERRADGAWLLHGEPPGASEASHECLMSRRRLLVEERPQRVRTEPDVDELAFRLRRLRREADAVEAELTRRSGQLPGRIAAGS